MKRYLIPAAAALALALPTGAQARVIELGAGGQPAAASNCPDDPCVAAYQVTAYQGRSGSLRNPFVVPRAGHIVAFTVALGELTPAQATFFNGRFGEGPQVRLAILRRSKRKGKRSNHRLMTQSAIYQVAPFLGSKPTFALAKPLRVQKDFRVALTVPTWAPVLDTVDLDGTDWWRSSRQKGQCGKDDQLSPPSAHQRRTTVVDYACTYFKSRLMYTATYIPDPRPTDGSARRQSTQRARTAQAAAASGQAPPTVVGGGVQAP